MANDQGTILGTRNWVEDVPNVNFTTTAVEQGALLVTNLKTREADDFWRFEVLTGQTSATVVVEFEDDVEIGMVATQFPRGTYPGVSESRPALAAGDQIRYRLLDAADVELWDSGLNDAGVVPGYMTHYAEVDPPVAARKLELTIDAPSRLSAGFCDVAILSAWSTLSPSVGFSYPGGFGWQLNNEVSRTPAGRPYTARFEPMRKWSLEFDWLSNTESLAISEMVRQSGGARQVLIKRGDLPIGYDAMFALVTPARDFESRTPELMQVSLTFEEFI